MEETKQYYDIEKMTQIRQEARKLRRQYLRYKEAELVYSIHHKKLLELAGKAGAIYRIDGTVLINRDIFEQYLEQFREESTLHEKSTEENDLQGSSLKEDGLQKAAMEEQEETS